MKGFGEMFTSEARSLPGFILSKDSSALIIDPIGHRLHGASLMYVCVCGFCIYLSVIYCMKIEFAYYVYFIS